jgi:Protein-tyrosine phosphatase
VAGIRRVVACTECGLFWDGGAESAKCRNDGHEHRVFETHRHLSLVVLPDGTPMTAASFDPVAPYSRARNPDYGLYLDSRWQPPWDHGYIDWPDFGVPANTEALVEALKTVLKRARSGQDIEVGCIGGHGRTGTALACLAVLVGHPALSGPRARPRRQDR